MEFLPDNTPNMASMDATTSLKDHGGEMSVPCLQRVADHLVEDESMLLDRAPTWRRGGAFVPRTAMMLLRLLEPKVPRRRASATVELAVLLPFLMFMFVVTIDYCRVFYFSIILANCARNGAVYGSDPYTAANMSAPYNSVEVAALADATDLSPQPTVQTTYGSNYVEVSVSYPFKTLTSYPGIPAQIDLKRTVRMQLAPTNPKL